jgi:2-polyprenyl-6-methoxyphenol hydroxylase-like FAD-dependent oxidoreductase
MPPPKNIAIIGGSLGGLLTGTALKRLHRNLNIRIFERAPTPLLHDQGAGVVASPDVQRFFAQYDKTKTPLAVTSHQRIYLDKAGNVIDREDSVQQMTSWDLLYHVLRANYDGVSSEYAHAPESQHESGTPTTTTTTYEYGCTVESVQAPKFPSNSNSDLDVSKPVELRIKRTADGSTSTTTADLVIAADGPSSKIRSLFFPAVKREYAGYVAWRGTIPETKMSASAAQAFSEKFAFFHGDATQILAYLIPGKNGSVEEGERLVNWVWYCNYAQDSPEHVELMTDKDGERHHVTLPPGGIQESVWARQKSHAAATLPPQFAELVQKTEVPFVQAITDVIAPRAVLEGGRVLLVGDALAGFRPHTAASTGQAALDAMSLAEAIGRVLDGEGMGALDEWEKTVMEYARRMQGHGVRLGQRSQFGTHPLKG